MSRPKLAAFVLAALLPALSLPAAATADPPRRIKLSLDGVTLVEAVKTISAFTGRNFIVEQALRDRRLTVISATAVGADEAYAGFLTALRIEGLAAVEAGGFVTITFGRDAQRPPPPGERGQMPPADDARPGTPSSDGSACAPSLLASIRKTGDSTWVLGRKALAEANGAGDCLLRQVRIVPAVQKGKVRGFKLFAIRPGSLAAALGVSNGDLLLAVNGTELSSPEKALEVYAQLAGTSEIRVTLERRGKTLTQVYRIE